MAGANEAALSWSQPTIGNETVEDYRITVSSALNACPPLEVSTEQDLLGSERSFDIVDLEEFSQVTITVTARNSEGEGSTVILTNVPPAGK